MAILCLLGVLALLDRSVILRGQTIVPSDTTSPRATRQAPGIPRAVAQIDQVSGGVGALVQLDGSSSTDPDSLPLNYHWTLVQGPVGSAARLTGDASVNPSFIPDRRGEYLVQLVVDNAAQTSHPDVVQVTVPNTPPVAKAGRDRLAGVGDSVLLDAGESSDADGDPLTYQWAFVSRPAGSRTRLSAPDTSTPSLLADKPGRYVVRLVASDREDSSGDVVNVDIAERAPAANAGADQTAVVGALVALDGSGSADIDGHRLKYTWRFAARPEGSSATLSGRRSVRPSFVVDMPGDYVVDLVVDDNLTESAVDSVHISTRNSAPVADGGRDLTAREGQTVRLDGSGSSDVDGNPLTFSWTLVSKPSRSNAILGDSRAANPTLSVDRRGTYEVHLVVNDGSADSAADIVRVAVANTPPVSAAGFDQRVERGATVTLDGSASTDVDGNELTYAWALTTVPDGSAAVLSDAAAVSPTFKVDVSGTYIAQLLASDGTAISRPDTVVVTTDRVSPVANAGFGQTVRAGQVVLLNGSASSEGDGARLTYQWSLVSKPAGSAATLEAATTAGPSFISDKAGDYIVQLIVNDGTSNSPPDTVVVTTKNSVPVSDAGKNQRDVPVASSVGLDASASFDADGQPLTYSWSLLARPAGSLAAISDPTGAAPTFAADVAGEYVAQLVVSDGVVDSVPDTVLIRTKRRPSDGGRTDRTVDSSATAQVDSGTSIGTAALPTVTVLSSDAAASEDGPNPGAFTVARTGDMAAALIVRFTLAGSAANGTDYTTLALAVSIAAGASSAVVRITPTADFLLEGSETVSLTLAAGDYTVGTPNRATVTIADGLLKNGATYRGSISRAGEIDAGRFTAAAGTSIIVSIGEVGVDSAFVPWIRLLGPNGVLVSAANNWGTLAAQFQVVAPLTGMYTVRVASADIGNNDTGTYLLTTVRVPGALTVAPGDQGGRLTNGGNHAGTIHVGDLDPWTVTAAAGESIVVSIGETGVASALVPWIRVFGPTGAPVFNGNNWGALAAQVQVTAPTAGIYTVVVSTQDVGNDASGTYLLTVVHPIGALTVSSGDQGGPLTNGGNHAGTIHVGDLDPWVFTATAGESVVVGIGETGAASALVPWIRVFGPTGAPVFNGNNWGELAAQVQVTAPATGTYTVVVSTHDVGSDASGNYLLTVVRTRGPLSVTAGDQGGPLTNGGNHAGTIHVGDLDPWTVTAAAGESIVVSIGETGVASALVPWIRVFGPTGAPVFNGNNWGALAAQVQVTAPVTGTYTVVVSTQDVGNDAFGSYLLTVVHPRGALTVTPGDQGGSLTNGGNHAGTIHVGDLDPWVFTATAGESVVVGIGETGAASALVPWIRVFGPTGAPVFNGNNWGELAAQVQVTAPATGTYTVVVSTHDVGSDASGNYLLTVVRTRGPLTVTAGDQGGPLTNGGNHAGTIHVGDLDPWTVTAAAGESIVVSIGETGVASALVPWIRVFGPTGAPVFNGNNWGALAAQVQVTAPTAGTYTVVVSTQDVGNDASGTYVLTVVHPVGALTVSAGDQGGALTKGATHAGTIHAGDLDPWSFTTVAGQVISLTISDADVNTAFVPWIRVFGPTGAPVFNGNNWGDLGATVRVAAPATGKYTVVISTADSGNDATGRYLLTQK